MKKTTHLFLTIFAMCLPLVGLGQTEKENQSEAELLEETLNATKGKVLDTLTYQTQSGLPIAASKIYFTDSKFTVSGFGETSFINYLGPKNRESQDLELYNTNLQRFVLYGAYKPVSWLVLYAEVFAEFANDGSHEGHLEYLPEVFVDFLIHDKFNVRVGTHQPNIGYINNHDEPIMFFTVNRPEVERLIIPSQWIDLGIMTYGNITKDLKWAFSVYQGMDATNLNGATWIRRGRDEALRFNFNGPLINGKFVYQGIKDTEFSVSGIWTQLGDGQEVNMPTGTASVSASTYLLSSYVRHTYRNWTFMALGAYGQMSNTDQIYHLTREMGMGAQVLGERVYGVYTEVSYDLLPLLRGKPVSRDSGNALFKPNEFKLPIFARVERLNTHAGINGNLIDAGRSQSDLSTLTVGFNFNPRRNVVLKTNYQFRNNRFPLSDGRFEGDVFEFGMGFIF